MAEWKGEAELEDRIYQEQRLKYLFNLHFAKVHIFGDGIRTCGRKLLMAKLRVKAH